jgi:hypothetical protein
LSRTDEQCRCAILERKRIFADELELKVSEPIKWMKPRVERRHIALAKMGGKQLVVTRYVYIEGNDTLGDSSDY